jgi:hypothetical protein
LNLPPPTKFTTNLTNPLKPSSTHCRCLHHCTTAPAAFLIAPPLPSSSRRRCLHCSAAGAPPLPSSSRCWFYLRRQAFVNTLLLPSSSRHCSRCLPHRAAAAFIVAPPLPSLFRCRRATTPFIVALLVLPSSSSLRQHTAAAFLIAPLLPLPSSSRRRCLHRRAAAAFIVPLPARHHSLHRRAAGSTYIVVPPLPSFCATAAFLIAPPLP